MIVGAAAEALYRRISASKTLQRQLMDGRLHAVMVGDDMTQTAHSVATLWRRTFPEIEGARGAEYTMGDVLMEGDAVQDEYKEHFEAAGYARSGLELTAEVTAALLSVLALESTDRFVDLGSSEGRVPLAAAVHSPVRSAVGIELSPSRHVLATAALARIRTLAADGGPVPAWEPFVGDFLDEGVLSAALPLPAGTPPLREVIWCAVQARQGRKIASDLLTAVHAHRRRAGVGGAPTRLLLAGFGLPDKAPGAILHCAHVFVRHVADEVAEVADAMPPTFIQLDDLTRVIPLFCSEHRSNNPGPRLVLEYHVHDV